MSTGVSLKTANVVPLSVLVVLQLIAVVMVNRSAFDLAFLDVLKDTGGIMLAVSVLSGWLSHLVPPEVKSVLVFWRVTNVLPGHRFIQLAQKDRRINCELLKERIDHYDALRHNHDEQNSYWYNVFYRPVTNEKEVATTHKSYLLYRDATSVSFIMLTVMVLGKLFTFQLLAGISAHSLLVFVFSIPGFAIAARNAGKRMVTTAVAIGLCETGILNVTPNKYS